MVVPATTAAPNNANKKVIFNKCTPFTIGISATNKIQADDAHGIGVVISKYN